MKADSAESDAAWLPWERELGWTGAQKVLVPKWPKEITDAMTLSACGIESVAAVELIKHAGPHPGTPVKLGVLRSPGMRFQTVGEMVQFIRERNFRLATPVEVVAAQRLGMVREIGPSAVVCSLSLSVAAARDARFVCARAGDQAGVMFGAPFAGFRASGGDEGLAGQSAPMSHVLVARTLPWEERARCKSVD